MSSYVRLDYHKIHAIRGPHAASTRRSQKMWPRVGFTYDVIGYNNNDVITGFNKIGMFHC